MKKVMIIMLMMLSITALSACDLFEDDGYRLALETEAGDVDLSKTPEGPFDAGDSVEVHVSWEDDTLEFSHWASQGEVVSESESFTHTIEGNDTLEAVFESEDSLNLEIESSHEGVDFDLDQSAPYSEGDTITVSPEYDSAALEFIAWEIEGDVISDSETLEYTLESDTTLHAVFESLDVEPTTYHETFEDFYETGSQYSDFSQVGTSGIEWHFTDTRTDVRFDNVSDAVTFGDAPARSASMKATIPEGIRSLSVYYENAFSSAAGLEIYINGELIATAEEVDGTFELFEVDGLDITGEFELELVPTSGQTTINDLFWENNVPGSDYPVVDLESDYWDAAFEFDPSNRVAPGESVEIYAYDTEETYDFMYWEDEDGNVISDENPYTFTLEEDVVYNAVFDNPEAYALALESNYYRAALEKDIDRPVVAGTTVEVSTSASEDYDFIAWEDSDGNVVSESRIFTYEMPEDGMTLNAIYDVPEPIDYEDMTLDELTDLNLDRYDGHYSDLEGLYGAALESELQTMLENQIEYLSYDDARDILQISDRDPDNPDNVIQFYTRESVPGEWDGGTTWNREHVWPNRRFPGARTSNLGSDLHNLTPADPGENSSRGYKYFDLETSGSSYEPHDDVKGDVSRMMFYMDVLYDDLTLVDDSPSADNYEMGDLRVMLEWHAWDDVSHFEMRRNDVIEDYQNNRNPFIDYPHLAYLLYYDHDTVGLD